MKHIFFYIGCLLTSTFFHSGLDALECSDHENLSLQNKQTLQDLNISDHYAGCGCGGGGGGGKSEEIPPDNQE